MKKAIKTHFKILVSVIACLLPLHFSSGQNPVSSKYIFSTIAIENGLPINFIDNIFKDSHGFMWIATQGGGLCRFDGYEFVQFNVSSFPITLKSNFIRETCEDNFNRLWITSNSGTDIIDLKTMQPSKIGEKEPLFKRLSEISASSILKDRNGNLWILSGKEIFKIDFDKNGSIKNICSTETEAGQPSHSFTTINEIDDEIWVGDNGSVYQILSNKSGKLYLTSIPYIPQMRSNLFISEILKKENQIWIGTEDGLYRCNLSDKNIKHYYHQSEEQSALSQNMITDLDIADDGRLIIGTLKGLNFYDPVSDQFEHISHSKDATSLNNDFINCILSDGNNLWIGTEGGGINKMTLRKLAIQNFIHRDKDPNSITPNPVNAILEDSKGYLWVGTVEGGLNRKNKGDDKFIHFTSQSSNISHNSVSALEEDANGNLWIGTWGKGFNILPLNPLPQKVTETFNTSKLDYIAVLKYDSINKGMWIGTNRNIFFFDDKTHTMHQPLPDSITQNIMGALGCLIDEDQNLWMGTSDGLIKADLQQFDPSTFTCPAQHFFINGDKISKLFFKDVTCIYQSQDQSIWMGSNGYGICRLIKEDGKYNFKSFTSNQGLVNNAVFGILEDEQGLIWVGTGSGLSCYNPETNHFVNYTKEDGLISNQFYWNASYKSPTSKNLYFGSTLGLCELKGSNQYAHSGQKKVIFTKLQILNKTVWSNENKYIETDIAYADRIDMHEQDKSFSIEFSALDYDNPSTIIYSYRLLGFDDKWIDVPANRRFTSYTNLKPGTYTLQVRCMSGNHDWSDNISELKIVVHPFFYKTIWFIGLCILAFITGAILFYRWRVNSFKTQRKILHKKVEERTQELKKQKTLLEEQATELKLQNEILISQNEKISSQRRQIIEMSKKVQDAMSDKISFFTNITHEFRTPITLIIGPIERALKLSTNPKVIEQLQYVARNSKHLLSLVNQLMDFRKVESDNISLHPVNSNLITYLDEVLLPFESFANERNITIRKFYRLDSPYLLFDEEAMRKLITNLFSNAIKFTPDGGIVSLYTASISHPENKEKTLYLCVRDTGIGIKEEDSNRIFNRFYQSEGHERYPVYGQSGTGIGLYLCKKIVNVQRGSIIARNKQIKGASIRVLLPLLRETTPAQSEDNNTLYGFEETKPDQFSKETLSDQGLSILVVEDNMDMRKYISSILTDYYKVTEAENGEEALKILKTKNIDFIISDLMMPVMDGFELSKKVKSDFSVSHIPFLMLTAKTSLDTRIKSFKTGVDEFLTKPFDEELLLTRINNILENRKAYQRKFSLHMDIEELNIAEESNDDKFLRKAIEMVKENYKNTGYEVSDFIEDMGVSKSVLNRKMQILTSQSAGNFIRNYRLTIAHELIIKNRGNMNISEIAYQVGFNDPKYFTRCFTKHFGTAPSEISKKQTD